MQLNLGFGTGFQKVNIPNENIQDILLANAINHELVGPKEVERALAFPIASRRLRDIVKPGEKITVITSDITRPLPTWEILPCVLDELYAAGIKKQDIVLVFALGSHRRQSEEEKKHLAGIRAWNEICCVDSDQDDCIHLGVTRKGTPVDITRIVANADRKICIGNIEFHYFAGYSGGVKAMFPGVSTNNAIQCNHKLMISEDACTGKIDGNPLRDDIEEAGKIAGVDFIVNVILDEQKRIVKAVAGDPVKAHREGCRYLDRMYKKELKKRADIVIVSQGGAPKDLNLYQTQKALDNAKHAVRKGGIIILIGSCKEGMGNKVFEEWMINSESPQSIIDRIGNDFKLGGHKAAAIAMVLKKAEIYLVSDMPDALVKSIFLTPMPSAQMALDKAFEKLGRNASVVVMPYGGSVLPYVNSKNNETK